MPRKKITEEYVGELVDKAKKIFYSSSLFDNNIKDLLISIEPCILISKDLPNNYYGCASIEHSRSYEVNEYNLREKVQYVMVEGRMSWHIIELNEYQLKKVSMGSVYDTVSHELAHLLEMRITGSYNRTNANYHNALWKKIHRAMGGCGMANEEGYLKWLLKNKSVK